MSCKFCGKAFKRGFNLRRHEREYCSRKDRSSQEMDFKNDFFSDFTDRSENLTTTDNELESAEQVDPWIPLIEEAKQRSNIAFEETKESLVNSGLDEESATKLAYSNILPKKTFTCNVSSWSSTSEHFLNLDHRLPSVWSCFASSSFSSCCILS